MIALRPIGIWSRQLRFGDPGDALVAASELEDLGYGGLWIPDMGGPIFETARRLLDATERVVVATGVLNVWMHDAEHVAAEHAAIDLAHRDRFLLGLGVGHRAVVNGVQPGRYRQPLAFMRAYLDDLQRHAPNGARPSRLLAALHPRMMELGRERTLGIHPYLVPTDHVRWLKATLGRGHLVVPTLAVVVERDPQRGRDIARRDLRFYLGMPNYTRAWRRFGFGDADFADGGSDRLVDALYGQGSAEAIAERVGEYRDAGADHVSLRVVTGHPNDDARLPREEWRILAEALNT